MVATAWWYANAFETMLNKEIDYLTASAMGVILTDGTPYAPNQDTHAFGSDVTNEVAEANGYLAGQDGTGEVLLSPTHANTLNASILDAADPAWTATGAGFTSRIAVFMNVETATAATNALLTWMDFGADETASGGGAFTIVLAGGGLATITPADATGFPA